MEPKTLAIDLGGTGIKVLTVGPRGEAIGTPSTIETPRPATPQRVVGKLVEVATALIYDRLTIGFPGLVHVSNGVVLTAPNLDGDWRGFELGSALTSELGCPIRVAKDADIHGFGAVSGAGVELMLTLGTGLGSSLFVDGYLLPNLDLAHHPMCDGATYEGLLGKRALELYGKDRGSTTCCVRLDNSIERSVLTDSISAVEMRPWSTATACRSKYG